ncbi:hypothetical protein PRIPAC_70620 [Pristionchus pacificus]|uniref:Homeobox domain-containing protein n=1 Tax=Pristionchus pacificus TaxID=54126 RepID=A0A454XNC7_PRIPA|nr:hypothetical protein PRIPAC_70620 [Pristionchus pacificus]|eukprot:PDM83727.1 Homeobox domain-containing protein [Pristionchus pacificus]
MGSMAYPTFPLSYHSYAAASTSSRSNIQKNTGKRERTTYTKHQLIYLEDEFTKGKYPEAPRREEIARYLGLEDGKIQIWFKNRRAKERSVEKQIQKMDTLRGSSGSTPSASSTEKSSPSSKVECSPDSTTVTPSWVKKEAGTSQSSPPSATVPTSLAAMPTPLTWSSPDSSMAPNSTSSPPGTTVPYNQFIPWMMGGTESTTVPPYLFNPSDPTTYQAMQYPQNYTNMFYTYDPSFYFPPPPS